MICEESLMYDSVVGVARVMHAVVSYTGSGVGGQTRVS